MKRFVSMLVLAILLLGGLPLLPQNLQVPPGPPPAPDPSPDPPPRPALSL